MSLVCTFYLFERFQRHSKILFIVWVVHISALRRQYKRLDGVIILVERVNMRMQVHFRNDWICETKLPVLLFKRRF